MHPQTILDKLKESMTSKEKETILAELIVELEEHIQVKNIYDATHPVILVDFDGVIHSYKSGWKGIDRIPDPPVDGAFEWLVKLTEDFDVRIYSARCNSLDGIRAMKDWFIDWGLGQKYLNTITFLDHKPSSFLHVDDRAWLFDGDFTKLTPDAIANFKPWYYEKTNWRAK